MHTFITLTSYIHASCVSVSVVKQKSGFVYAIIFIIFILDLTFAVNLWLQWFKWKDYLKVCMIMV
jgi:Heliorhodopsin